MCDSWFNELIVGIIKSFKQQRFERVPKRNITTSNFDLLFYNNFLGKIVAE